MKLICDRCRDGIATVTDESTGTAYDIGVDANGVIFDERFESMVSECGLSRRERDDATMMIESASAELAGN